MGYRRDVPQLCVKLSTKGHRTIFRELLTTLNRMVADVWKKDVWDFQAKSGSSSSCSLLPSFPREKSQFKKYLGEHLEVPDIRGLLTEKVSRD